MKHIHDLKDIGKGERCLIVGGGHSVTQFDFDNLPLDVTIISCNNHMYDYADIVIYYDKEMQYFFKQNAVPADYMLAFKNNTLDHTCGQTTHYYTYSDMIFGDTGFHALQFADKVFNFSEIYLIGYDYNVCGESYHYGEYESDPRKMQKFIDHSIGKVKSMYHKVEWKNKIYNSSKISDLDAFIHRKLDN